MLKRIIRILLSLLGYSVIRKTSVESRLEYLGVNKKKIGRGLPTLYSCLVEKYFLKQKNDFIFAIIGAHDGESSSDVYTILANNNVKGVLVEPNPNVFPKLEEAYKNNKKAIIKNYAISKTEEKLPFYMVNEEAFFSQEHIWLDTISSFDINHINKHIKNLKAVSGNIEKVIRLDVDCISLQELFASTGISHLSLLQIDTEGYDAQIIRQISQLGFYPNILCFEYIHLSDNEIDYCINWLNRHNYAWRYEGLNIYGELQVKE
jgi:FkbM family methyltransferase